MIPFTGVLEEPINTNDNEATLKAKTFYNTCMDTRKYLYLFIIVACHVEILQISI